MQTEQEVKQRRPFHETVLDVIRYSNKYLDGQTVMACLAKLIKMTEIPKGHDEIIAAWNQRMQELGWSHMDLGVVADLLEQKQEAEKQEAQKREEENKAKKQVEEAAASWAKRSEYS